MKKVTPQEIAEPGLIQNKKTDSEPARLERNLPGQLALRLDASFEELVLTYQDRLYAFAFRLSGSPQDAEEITQDTFVRAYRALKSYPAERVRLLALRPWLYQIALNAAHNARRGKRLQYVPFEAANSDVSWEPADDPQREPEASVEQAETNAELASLIAALPERYRAAVVLRHVEGLGYHELTNIFQQPVGTIKSNVHRGLAMLRTALENQTSERNIK